MRFNQILLIYWFYNTTKNSHFFLFVQSSSPRVFGNTVAIVGYGYEKASFTITRNGRKETSKREQK
jgi:hypothetical protein